MTTNNSSTAAPCVFGKSLTQSAARNERKHKVTRGQVDMAGNNVGVAHGCW